MAKKKGKPNKKIKKDTYNKDVLGISIIVISLIYSLSIFGVNMGIVGNILKVTSFSLMGFGAYFFSILSIIVGVIFIIDTYENKEIKVAIYTSIIFASVLIILDGINPLNITFIDRIKSSIELGKIGRGGINLLLLTNIKISDLISLFKREIQNKTEKKEKTHLKEKKQDNQNNKVKVKNYNNEDIKILDYRKSDINEQEVIVEEDIDIDKEIKIKNTRKNIANYKIPSLSLLNSPLLEEGADDETEIRKNAKIIKETMKNFNIDAKVIQINKGPTITCYELEPAPGIKLSKIVSLSDNISLSLASPDIRIEAPIPGKAAVGIEVPNKVKSSVFLKELLLSAEYRESTSKVPLALGKDVSGEVIVSSIDKMPHLLIAGATGSGKSVCINTIIMNIQLRKWRRDIRPLLRLMYVIFSHIIISLKMIRKVSYLQ